MKMPEITCGIYFLRNGFEIVYVGQSVNVVSRVATHRAEGIKEFDSWHVLPCEREELDELEAEFIQMMKPKYNGQFPCKGRFEPKVRVVEKYITKTQIVEKEVIVEVPVEVFGNREPGIFIPYSSMHEDGWWFGWRKETISPTEMKDRAKRDLRNGEDKLGAAMESGSIHSIRHPRGDRNNKTNEPLYVYDRKHFEQWLSMQESWAEEMVK